MRGAWIGVVVVGWVASVAAQEPEPDSLARQPSDTVTIEAADMPRAISPGGAFWRSLVIPGWGQSHAGRHVTGALFLLWEGITMTMTLKADQQVRYLKRVGSPSLEGKRQEREDWLILWIFNHLFSGAEAFVSAHLKDFPGDLRVRAVPGGIAVAVPLP